MFVHTLIIYTLFGLAGTLDRRHTRMSPCKRDLSRCCAFLVNLTAATSSDGSSLKRPLLAAAEVLQLASSVRAKSHGKQHSHTTMMRAPLSGFAVLTTTTASSYRMRWSQVFSRCLARVRRPSCPGWVMPTSAVTRAISCSSNANDAVSGDTCIEGTQKSSGPPEFVEETMKVTLLSGFLGAGKTTLMSNILRQARERELSLAVIVNDMADVNIDAQMIARSGRALEDGDINGDVRSVSDRAIAMQDGCICCTLRDELLLEVEDLARGGRYKHLIIESTGISDPMPVAEAFVTSALEEDADRRQQGYCLDTLVTVVDSTSFLDEVQKADDLEERGLEAIEGDTRTIADLLVSQVEFANVILLNKADLVTDEEMSKLEAVVQELNPAARVMRTVGSSVGLAEVVGTGRFDLEEASQAAGWVQALNEEHPDIPSVHAHHVGGRRRARGSRKETFGIGSFTFRAQRPFHPERLMEFVMNNLPSVLRSKGFVWLATRQGDAGVWNQAGGSFATEYGGSWDGGEASESLITPVVDGDEPDGVDDYDKSNVPRNELVLIGLDMDQRALHSALQSCLLSDKEMDAGPAEWARMTDPFPPWQEDEDE